MTAASHAAGPEFDPRRVYKTGALIVQWLEYLVANEVAGVRFPVSASFFYFLFYTVLFFHVIILY